VKLFGLQAAVALVEITAMEAEARAAAARAVAVLVTTAVAAMVAATRTAWAVAERQEVGCHDLNWVANALSKGVLNGGI
jgi:hypothetical protein